MFETLHEAPGRRRVVRTGREATRQPPARGTDALRPPHPALPAIHRSARPPFDLVTVYKVAEFIVRLEPERQAQPWWESCGLALVRASKSRKRRDFERAAELLRKALRREDWLASATQVRDRKGAARVSSRRSRSLA
jgi:hypothetical protein